MTTATLTAPASVTRPRIMSRALALTLAVNVGALLSLYLLLSVVPLYAGSVGAGGIGAGLATGALMLSTVLAELVTPAWWRRSATGGCWRPGWSCSALRRWR